MSQHYKIIRRTREAIKDLKSKGWAPTKIAKHIGVNLTVVQDILIIDEVAMNLRTPTIEKFEKFLKKQAAVKKHFDFYPSPPEQFRAQEARLQKKVDESEPQPEPEPLDESPKDTTIGLLAKLTELSVRFVACGYRLDASLTMIHDPNEPKQKV